MIHELDFGHDVPTQRDLKALQPLIESALPEDPTPTLDDIARSPKVEHLGEPKPAPQLPHLNHPLRLIVHGTDAAMSAVLTRLMRADACWVELAYRPVDTGSPLSHSWNLHDVDPDALHKAPCQPTPLIRDDAGIAVAGEATVTSWEGTELYGEIIVDSSHLCAGLKENSRRVEGTYGARLVPMLTAPGLVAAPIITGPEPRRRFLRTVPAMRIDADRMLTGRALQAGGKELRVSVDAVSRKRPVEGATFYRHLRDIQVVRF